MVEEFRTAGVQFYDGWLIVRVVDHRTVMQSANSSDSSGGHGKPFSIHNYNPYITPSPYAPYPTKEQTGQRSPQLKQEQRDSANRDGSSDARPEDTVAAPTRTGRPKPKTYHVALRPTILSSHMELVMDAMTPDPKSLNRKQSQANTGRGAGGAPPTPVSGVPTTPAIEKGPPLKKQRLRIDAKDLLDYEARVVNATAPPLYLDVAESLEDAEAIIAMLRDAHHDAPPPSSKSRKRTVAELAADDAHAKQQERFMLIMDERNAGNATGANAGAVESQAGVGLFQPRFEKFNALENIKRDIAERKQREKDRQLQEDETRRGAQERQAEEDRRRMAVIQRQREVHQLKARQEQEMRAQAHQAAQAQQAQNQRLQQQQQPQQQQQQASSIPPQMQSQMMAAQARPSPNIRHSTPNAASSPIINQQGGQAMAISSSQQGAGSPQRPGSVVQHGHPGVAMARGPSGQGPSRHGTPQIPHNTPGMGNATPIMRRGTPAQHMTQASPHGSMMAPTPQMAHAAAMQGQAQQGMPPQQQYTAQQVQQFQQARAAMQQQAALRSQQMVNGTSQMQPAQVAEMHAQQQRQAAMQRMQQAQAMQQQGNPQTPQMVAQSPVQGTAQYKQQLAEQMKAQMQQASNSGSPAPTQMTPQQQHAAQLAHQQQQQQRMMQQNQQQNQMMGMTPQMQQQQQQQRINPQFFQNAMQTYQQKYMAQMAQKYGGNTGMLNQQDLAHVHNMAQQAAMQEVNKRRAQAAAQAQAKAQAAGQHMQPQQATAMRPQQQQQGGQMPNGMMGMQQGHPNAGGQGGVNMNAMLQQQQAAHHMQQMHMAHAQQQLQQMQQAQHQSPQQQGGGGGVGMQGGMASIQAYQQQLQQMQQQQQQQQRQG